MRKVSQTGDDSIFVVCRTCDQMHLVHYIARDVGHALFREYNFIVQYGPLYG